MATASRSTGWTAEKVRELPGDGNRYEVVDGLLLVTPAPSWEHQEAAAELFVRLREYLRGTGAGHAIIAPADVEFTESRMVEPDVFVVPSVDGRRPRHWDDVGRLLLAVEILSPATATADRQLKRRLYQRQGVPEYWIVDLNSRLVERWRPADEQAEVVGGQLVWRPVAECAPLVIDLPAYFGGVLGE